MSGMEQQKLNDSQLNAGPLEPVAYAKSLELKNIPRLRWDEYKSRKEDEAIKNGLELICNDSKNPVLFVTGSSGNGKTTTMANIFRRNNNRFLQSKCGVHVVIWLNCYRWNENMTQDDQDALISRLTQLTGCSEAEDRKTIDQVVDFSQEHMNQRPIFVLDDCFNMAILETFRRNGSQAKCCVITRTLPKSPALIGNYVECPIGGLSESELVEVMLLKAKNMMSNLTTEQMKELAKHCCGSALVATHIAARFNRENPERCAAIYEEIMQYGLAADLKSAQHLSLSTLRPEEQTVHSMFISAIASLKDNKQKEQYLAFLLFDPAVPVSASELAILWGVPPDECFRSLQAFKKLGLVTEVFHQNRETESEWDDKKWKYEPAYMIHHIFHEAAFAMAKQHWNFPEDVTTIRQMREKLLIRMAQQATGEENEGGALVKFLFSLTRAGGSGLIVNFCSNDKFTATSFSDLVKSSELYQGELGSNGEDNTALLVAASCGLLQLVKLIYNYSPNTVKVVDKNGATPLYCAAQKGHFEVFQFLLEKWPDGVKVANNDGQTPLYWTVRHGQLEMAQFLAEKWPDAVKLVNKKGETPLHMAAFIGHFEMVKFLAEIWPEGVKVVDRFGQTALSLAASNGDLETVKLLTEKWPDGVTVEDTFGDIPLYHAAQNRHVEVVQFLAESWPEAAAIAARHPPVIGYHIDENKFRKCLEIINSYAKR